MQHSFETPPVPTVSIVIPAYNEEKTIEKCVRSCFSQTQSPLEVIVVNNRSTDQTVEVVKRLQREYVGHATKLRLLEQNETQGLIPTRNYGMAAAKGDVLGRIDADSTLDSEWVSVVAESYQDASVDAMSGPVIYHDMPAKKLSFRADHHLRAAYDKLAEKYLFLFGSNMTVRRTVWESTFPHLCLDEEDLLHEDIDIALHLHKLNYNVIYNRRMIGGMSARRLEDSPKDFYNYIMRFERTYKRHGVSSRLARVPIFIYLSVYFPFKFIRFTYDADEEQFTFERFRKLVKRRRGNSREDEIVI